jgi:hypothetical protein
MTDSDDAYKREAATPSATPAPDAYAQLVKRLDALAASLRGVSPGADQAEGRDDPSLAAHLDRAKAALPAWSEYEIARSEREHEVTPHPKDDAVTRIARLMAAGPTAEERQQHEDYEAFHENLLEALGLDEADIGITPDANASIMGRCANVIFGRGRDRVTLTGALIFGEDYRNDPAF